MAHEITRNDSFGYVGRKAWHGLGNAIETGLPVKEAFRRLGLDWNTELLPVQGVMNALDDRTREIISAPDFRMHVRSDLVMTKPEESVLGIVGKDYKPVPNAVLASFADSLVTYDPEAAIETAGSLRGGKRVFSLVKLGDPVKITEAKGDQLVPYLLVTNSHDGTGAFRAYFTTIRVVCANTHRWAEAKAGSAGFWYRHDGDISAKVAEARRILGLAASQTKDAAEQARFLSSHTVATFEVERYFQRVYEATFGKQPKRKTADDLPANVNPDQVDELLTTANRAADEYDEKQKLATSAMCENYNSDGARGTAWGAYNAVSEYHDHQRGRGAPKRRDLSPARVHSNLFGASAGDKQKAMALALEMARD